MAKKISETCETYLMEIFVEKAYEILVLQQIFFVE